MQSSNTYAVYIAQFPCNKDYSYKKICNNRVIFKVQSKCVFFFVFILKTSGGTSFLICISNISIKIFNI